VVVVLVHVVVFSSRNPPPNRLSSRPLNNRLLPKFTNEAHSPPGDDDCDAIGNTIAPRALRLLRLKVAARPPEEKKALLKLSLVLNKRDEHKGALIVLLINTLLL
jgi:hypothetical protein